MTDETTQPEAPEELEPEATEERGFDEEPEETISDRVDYFCSIANEHLADLGCHDSSAKAAIRAIAYTVMKLQP